MRTLVEPVVLGPRQPPHLLGFGRGEDKRVGRPRVGRVLRSRESLGDRLRASDDELEGPAEQQRVDIHLGGILLVQRRDGG
eukprot:6620106-Heterocapsa_arctica.AAC.1